VYAGAALVVVLLSVIAWQRLHSSADSSRQGRRFARTGPMPVSVAAAAKKSFELYVGGLGNVTPLEVATVRSRVDGELVKVAKSGDILLIEDQDRFSRANPMAAMLSLQTVVNKGIRVVFMRNGNEVNRDNFNELPTIVPTFFAALFANQENEKRAYRIKQSWEKRYAELRSGKVTRMQNETPYLTMT